MYCLKKLIFNSKPLEKVNYKTELSLYNLKMHYFYNRNAIFICLALYIMIITFISFNILVFFTGITKLVCLTDRKREEETFKLI